MRKTSRSLWVFVLLMGLNEVYALGNSDEATALATIRVRNKISLVNKSDLKFRDAYPGDEAEVVPPESENSALFEVSGQSETKYLVSIPAKTIFMKVGLINSPDNRILVSDFRTNLGNDIGKITNGKGSFRVGASRAALRPTQSASDRYEGKFLVRVTYFD